MQYSSQFACENGRCVYGSECDGNTDCSDGSDEENQVPIRGTSTYSDVLTGMAILQGSTILCS